jgi:hypothetical protein
VSAAVIVFMRLFLKDGGSFETPASKIPRARHAAREAMPADRTLSGL